MKKNNNALENAGGKEIIDKKEQGAVMPASEALSVGKFADVESLSKAYNQLESEFTKRSQRLRELEREVESLKEQSAGRAESEVVQDETGSAAGERTNADSESVGEGGGLTNEVERFLKDNPEACGYADEIIAKIDLNGEPESGFLYRAYVGVLKDMLLREREKITDEFILRRATDTKSIRDEIIRGYLAELYSAKREYLLSGNGGESVVAPPIKPATISEAGKMAYSVLRKK